jgi:hypothetical protein
LPLTEARFQIMLGHNRKKILGAECMADMLKRYGVTFISSNRTLLSNWFVVSRPECGSY